MFTTGVQGYSNTVLSWVAPRSAKNLQRRAAGGTSSARGAFSPTGGCALDGFAFGGRVWKGRNAPLRSPEALCGGGRTGSCCWHESHWRCLCLARQGWSDGVAASWEGGFIVGSGFGMECERRWAGLTSAAIAQLGERKTEDLKVPGSIPGLGIFGEVCRQWGRDAFLSWWRKPMCTRTRQVRALGGNPARLKRKRQGHA